MKNYDYSIDDVAGVLVKYSNDNEQGISINELSYCLRYINKQYFLFKNKSTYCYFGKIKAVKSYYTKSELKVNLITISTNDQVTDVFNEHDLNLILKLFIEARKRYIKKLDFIGSLLTYAIIVIVIGTILGGAAWFFSSMIDHTTHNNTSNSVIFDPSKIDMWEVFEIFLPMLLLMSLFAFLAAVMSFAIKWFEKKSSGDM